MHFIHFLILYICDLPREAQNYSELSKPRQKGRIIKAEYAEKVVGGEGDGRRGETLAIKKV